MEDATQTIFVFVEKNEKERFELIDSSLVDEKLQYLMAFFVVWFMVQQTGERIRGRRKIVADGWIDWLWIGCCWFRKNWCFCVCGNAPHTVHVFLLRWSRLVEKFFARVQVSNWYCFTCYCLTFLSSSICCFCHTSNEQLNVSGMFLHRYFVTFYFNIYFFYSLCCNKSVRARAFTIA